MTSDIAEWSSTLRAALAAGLGGLALALLAASLFLGDRVGKGESETAGRLNSSAWSMSTRQILRGWGLREVKLATVVYLLTALFFVSLGAAGLIVTSSLAHATLCVPDAVVATASGAPSCSLPDWIERLGNAAAVVSIAVAAVGLVEQLCLVGVVRRYVKSNQISWLGVTTAFTLMLGRSIGLALVAIYVIAATAAL